MSLKITVMKLLKIGEIDFYKANRSLIHVSKLEFGFYSLNNFNEHTFANI